MKLRTLIESKSALESLLIGSLPINIAWELKKFIKFVNPELTTFEEIKNEKIRELGEKFEENGKEQFRVKEKNTKKYTELMDELLDRELTAAVPYINIKELVDHRDVNGKGISINTGDLEKLDWLITE